MARLPSPGSDQGKWGEILNDFLSVEHNPDGSLKAGASLGTKYAKPGSGIPESDLADDVRTKLNATPTAHTHVKSDVGLANVDNTSDANKPISNATQVALDAKVNTSSLSTVATTGNYTDLINRPTLTGNNMGDQTLSISGANLTISGANGNTVVLPSGSTGSAGWGTISGTLSDQSDLQAALDAKQAAGSYATTSSVTSSLATKLDASQKAAVNGVASLDGNSHVPAAQLGSGTANNTTYLRGDGTWATVDGGSGTVTVADITDATTTGRSVLTATDISAARTAIGAGTSNLEIGTSSTTAAAGNHTHTKADVGLANVDNTSDLAKPVSTATQAALNVKMNRAGTGALRMWPASTAFPTSGMVAGDLFPHITGV